MSENELYTACLNHAGDLLKAAKKLHEEKLHNIAFHLATACLEEIGKAILLINMYDPLFNDDRFSWKQKYVHDHIKKIFWALWTPYLCRKTITKKELDEIRGHARSIHDTRLKGLYFNADETGYEVPADAVSDKMTVDFLNLVESRFELACSKEIKELDENDRDLMRWFIDATSNEEDNKFIFCKISMDKLVEIGNTNEWIIWLKDELDKAEQVAVDLCRRELSKEHVSEERENDKKWSIRIRLFSNTHSVRQQPLKAWNERIDWLNLGIGNKRNNEIIVKIDYLKAILLQNLWVAGFSTINRFVCSLNIAASGFIWWYIPKHTGKYFDQVIDIETGHEIAIEERPNLKIDLGNRVLTERILGDALFCFMVLPDPSDKNGYEPFHKYLIAMSHMSKTDVFHRNEEVVYRAFFDSLKSGLKYYEKINDMDFIDALIHFLEKTKASKELINEIVDQSRTIENKTQFSQKITLTEVWAIKVICDKYLNHNLRNEAEKRFQEFENQK